LEAAVQELAVYRLAAQTLQEVQTVSDAAVQEPIVYLPAAQTLHVVQEAALEVVE
jgi:hypothetical protein